jgi:hypothetical protein
MPTPACFECFSEPQDVVVKPLTIFGCLLEFCLTFQCPPFYTIYIWAGRKPKQSLVEMFFPSVRNQTNGKASGKLAIQSRSRNARFMMPAQGFSPGLAGKKDRCAAHRFVLLSAIVRRSSCRHRRRTIRTLFIGKYPLVVFRADSLFEAYLPELPIRADLQRTYYLCFIYPDVKY